jgi:hypothetical protein
MALHYCTALLPKPKPYTHAHHLSICLEKQLDDIFLASEKIVYFNMY